MNLATVFGPNLLRAADDNDMMAIVRDSPRINRLMVHLIDNAGTFFQVRLTRALRSARTRSLVGWDGTHSVAMREQKDAPPPPSRENQPQRPKRTKSLKALHAGLRGAGEKSTSGNEVRDHAVEEVRPRWVDTTARTHTHISRSLAVCSV